MDKRASIYVTIIAIVGLTADMSCENSDLTLSESIENVEKTVNSTATGDSTNIDCYGGISFELESDSLEEAIEEIYFQPNGWEEAEIDTDL